MASSEPRETLTLRPGYIVDADVVHRLLDLEHRGARFELKPDGGFRVVPPSVLTGNDTAFLRLHRDEARRVLQFRADDRHLFTDKTLAQEPYPPRGQTA